MVKATSQEILDSANRIKKQEAEDKEAGLLEIKIEKRIKEGKPKPDKKKTKNPGRGGKGNIVNLKDGGFPDLSGDGKVTQKDILIGKGVINKKRGGMARGSREGSIINTRTSFKKGGAVNKKKILRAAKRGFGIAKRGY